MSFHIKKPMHREEIIQAEDTLCRSLSFTDGVPVLRIPVDERYDKKRYYSYSGHVQYGTLLFDGQSDPDQMCPLQDQQVEQQCTDAMIRHMEAAEAPQEQYVRLGLEHAGV